MAITTNTTLENTILDGFDTACNSGTLEIRTGAAPGAGNSATGTVLATITLPADAFADRKLHCGRSSIRGTYGAIADHARAGGRPAACRPVLGRASWDVCRGGGRGVQYLGGRI